MKRKEDNAYYLGLDIGTDSIGYAVTDPNYTLKRFKGEPLWGSCLFDPANPCAERRGFRTARRRLDRRQLRVRLLREFFAHAIEAVDPRFFTRLRESALYATDKSDASDNQSVFNDEAFKDAEFHNRYPTIHHLIVELMENPEPHDVRLVYLACAWLMAHRGHFLQELDLDNVAQLDDITELYGEMMERLNAQTTNEDGETTESPDPFWECDPAQFGEILARRSSLSSKRKALLDLLFPGEKKPKSEGYRCDRYEVISLLCGYDTVQAKKLFRVDGESDRVDGESDAYADGPKLCLAAKEEDFEAALAQLQEEDAELVRVLKKVYDWSILREVRQGGKTISAAKVAMYEQHRKDLDGLKRMLRKGPRKLYLKVFKADSGNAANYAAYIGNAEGVKRATIEAFSDWLKKTLAAFRPDAEDRAFYDDMMERLETRAFLPKQVNGDNRVIPHQLYQVELRAILRNASGYLPFLKVADEDGTVAEKIDKVFAFRVPYYVGPLVGRDKSPFAWMVRKTEGLIRPWNFNRMVDMDKSEDEFIRRMTGICSYLPGEDVLPADSLVYQRFAVLNEINPLKVNDVSLPVEAKQEIFSDLFERKRNVTYPGIESFLRSQNLASADDRISGIDETVKSSLKTYAAFRGYLDAKTLTEEDVERIVLRSACTTDAHRFKKWLRAEFGDRLDGHALAKIAGVKCSEFGRLSRKFLTGIVFECKETGESGTVMDFLWRHNVVLMQLLGDGYTLAEKLNDYRRAYYAEPEHRLTLEDRMKEMYLSSAVRRQVFRALDVVRTVTKVMGGAPAKVFVEMARGATPDQKGKRTDSRADQVRALLKGVCEEEARAVNQELERMGDGAHNRLQSDALYLWTLQLGHCAYCGEPLKVEEIKSRANLDHILPRCDVKDDSVRNNLVLSCSTCNGQKTDTYPVPETLRNEGLWTLLRSNGLMTDEKFRRLMRREPLTDAERQGFINRQLVETRQTTKAVFTLLGEMMPDSEIVSVKAGLVSDFRHEFRLVKCREVNDLHHAKDAYLNIAVGNVYHEKFSRQFFRLQDGYSMKVTTLMGKGSRVANARGVAWDGVRSLMRVKATVARNDVRLTKYALTNKGGLFDAMPLPAGGGGTIPRKRDLPVETYGGYRKPAAAGYVAVRALIKKKRDIVILPIDLLDLKAVSGNNSEAAEAVVRKTLAVIFGDAAAFVDFPIGRRLLKVNTVIELDGCPYVIRGKSGGGSAYLVSSLRALVLPPDLEAYVKRLSSLAEKLRKNRNLTIDEKYDKVTADDNLALYRALTEAAQSEAFRKMPASQAETLAQGEDRFRALSVADQVKTLLNVVMLMKTNRSGGCDLTGVGGVAKAGVATLSSKVSNWKKAYKTARIVHTDFAGVFVTKSPNLLDLL